MPFVKIMWLYLIEFVILLSLLYFLFKYPEITFGLFLFAGCFKADTILQNILPKFFDLTIFFGSIVVISIIFNIIKNKLKIPKISNKLLLPYIILVVIMFGSLIYTKSPVYGTDKFLRFITITTLAIFAPIFLFKTQKKLNNFFYSLIAISTLMNVNSIFNSTNLNGFHTAFGSNYLALGRITGMSFLIITFYFLSYKNTVRKKIFWIFLLLLNLFGIFYGGGRGPMVSLAITLLFSVIFILLSLSIKNSKYNNKTIKKTLFMILTSIIVLFSFAPIFYTSITRTKILFTQEQGGKSASRRLHAYNTALNDFIKKPILGSGVGGFSDRHAGIDQRIYPHNIFLEIGSELGILGLISFLALVAFCFVHLLRTQINPKNEKEYLLATTILFLLIFMLLNSCVSGDINDNRTFFVWIGVAYALNNIFLYARNQKLNNFKKIQ